MNKKGFTLLEVMLAVAILAIVSSMMMTGFLTTMTYSYNSSLYAKIGAGNYANAITAVADLAQSSTMRREMHNSHKVKLGSGSSAQEYTTTGYTITYYSGATVNTEALRITDAASTGINTSHYNAGASSSSVRKNADYAEANGSAYAYNGNSTYSDNRSAFFYYLPYNCPYCSNNGKTPKITHMRFSSSDDYEYWCENTAQHPADLSAYTHQDGYILATPA
jgi:prepilin-type N-terminal cleavage/methylation domain-containing protein